MVKRWLVLLFVLAALGGCGSRPSEAIHFALSTAPVSLDPRMASDATSERINRLLYARLVDFDEQARPVASLADWQRLSPRHYRVRLGDRDRLFHNGEQLAADDVAATYRSILDPGSASPHRAVLEIIERIEVMDGDTVDFHLRRPDPLFPGYLTIGIVPAEVIAAGQALNRRPLGSGPMRLVSWREGGALVLERRTDGQRVVFEPVRDPTMRALKLVRGEVDILQNDLPPELLQWLRGQSGIRVVTRPGNNFAYLGFHLEDPDTGKPEVRRAIDLALDRPAIIDYLFRGAARPAASVLPPEHWAGARQLKPRERDLAKARELLASAGYSTLHPLRLSYKTSNDPFRIRIASIVQQQLAEAGIRVDVESYDWGTFFGDIKNGRFQMYSLAWIGVKSPDIFRYAFHSASLPPGGANRGRLQDTRVDWLIEAAMAAEDLDTQADWYRQLQEHLDEQLPYVPLWYEDQFYAAGAAIEGYTLAVDGNYDALVRTFKSPSRQLR
jgi:peptide/nickel transport system substrate-binding protein